MIVTSPGSSPAALVSAPWLVDPAVSPIAEGAVLLDGDGVVLTVGPRAQLRQDAPQVPEKRARGALMPALVNAHVHLELAALRGRAPGGAGLVAWVRDMQPMRAELGPDETATAIAAACTEQVRLGVGFVGDVGNDLEGALAAGAAGLGGIFFHELLGSRHRGGRDALRDARAQLAAVPWPPGLGYVPAPHAPYSVPPDLMRRIFADAARIGLPTSIHVAEDMDELHLLRDGSGAWEPVLRAMGAPLPPTGRSPLAYVASLGAFDGPLPPLLVHMVHADEADRRLAARAGAPVVLCPRSNLHIGGLLPDVPALLADGVSLALGTDSAASAPDGSLWAEIFVLRQHFPQLPEQLWLRAAVCGGAEALQLSGRASLAPGQRPRLIDVALDDPAHPVASLVRNTHPEVAWL